MEATNQVSAEQKADVVTTDNRTQQKEAVYQLALGALGSARPADGQSLRSLVTKEVRKQIRLGLFEGIKNGSIKYSRADKTDGALKKYCSSLINNWLKKDPRFN